MEESHLNIKLLGGNSPLMYDSIFRWRFERHRQHWIVGLRMLSLAQQIQEFCSTGNIQIYFIILQQLFNCLSTSASRSPLRMVAKKMNYTYYATIYALAQCTRQLSHNERRMCICNLTDFGVYSCCLAQTRLLNLIRLLRQWVAMQGLRWTLSTSSH